MTHTRGPDGTGDSRDRADRTETIWLAYVKLGGSLPRVSFGRQLAGTQGLDTRDRLIVDQVLFEDQL